jgi:hypothetical protein
MLPKSNSYYYQQINTRESKKISVTKESYAPRTENGSTYTIIKTVKKTLIPKGEDECLCGLDHKNLSSNKYSKNYSSYSKLNKFQEGKSSRVSTTTEKKSRVENSEKRNVNRTSFKDERNCTCGKDHSKSKITETKIIIKSGAKKCLCGKKICTCDNEQKGNMNIKTFVKKNENKTRVNSLENYRKKEEKKTTYKINQSQVKSEKRIYQEKKCTCDENKGCLCGCTCENTFVCTCGEIHELEEEEKRRKQKLLEEQRLKRERERKRLEEEERKKK